MNFKPILENRPIHTSVPCRVDFGGTLDISTFYLGLAHASPATFNLALDMRTHVRLLPWDADRIKISSRGFDSIERSADDHGLDNPMGLMFAVARYFNARGVHIIIDSTSPPKSALGGSSSAATAVIAAFYAALDQPAVPEHVAWLAHYLESSVAGVPCGVQDQTAAAFGGVNLWKWGFGHTGPKFDRQPMFTAPGDLERLDQHLLVAYCGIPHESKNVNSRWVAAFKSGKAVQSFEQIAQITLSFAAALESGNFKTAAALMNQETRIRCRMTPDVLDDTGYKLFEQAQNCGCGARFTGAGGGGCLWALGEKHQISTLKGNWQTILDTVEYGQILDTAIDPQGIRRHNKY